MNLFFLIGSLAGLALVAQLIHYWRRPAFLLVLVGTPLVVWTSLQASASSLDILSATLTLEPAPRLLLAFGLALTGLLALATTAESDRVSLGLLFWSWVPWLIALVVSDFVVAVFAWALGLILAVLGMRPPRYQRASGAAYFLALVVIAAACLLLADRFVVIYPLTPERTVLLQFSLLFLAWGFGILLALFPFHLWVGPMTDDAPLPVTALLLGLGQPVGLWLLFRLLSQYSWLADKTNLFDLLAVGGAGAVLVGGVWAAFERRAGRLLGYLAIFSFGLALLDLSQATRDGLANAGLGLGSRALSLTALACAITVSRVKANRWVPRLSLAVYLVAGLSLLGLRLGLSFSERYVLLAQIAANDQRLFAILLLAHIGALAGIVSFAQTWWLGAVIAAAEPEALRPAQAEVRQERELAPALAVAGAGAPLNLSVPAERPGGEQPEGISIAGGGDGKSRGVYDEAEIEREKAEAAETEEYVFEEHVRELAAATVSRLGPYLVRGARSLPTGARALILLVWRSWPTWTSISVLAGVTILLLALALAPQTWSALVSAALAQAPFVR